MAALLGGRTTGLIMKGESVLSRFRGALIGAVVGDCLGAHFENQDNVKVEDVTNFFARLTDQKCVGSDSSDSEATPPAPKKERRLEHSFTDDTAMMRSVAATLIAKRGMDQKDMATRFVTEYTREPWRGYGANVGQVFKLLKSEGCANPHGPAGLQFDGTGSYGNGGAMRIAPAALFGFNMDQGTLNGLVDEVTMITHTHRDAINGAKLQCAAVKLALQTTTQGPLEVDRFIEHLHQVMEPLELEDLRLEHHGSPPPKRRAKRKSEEVEEPYCYKLRLIQKFLKEDTDISRSEIEDALGNNVSALGSVPAAVYCFLRCLKPVADVKVGNPFERTIVYAVTLGGDTDTIAAMAGAIAGAYHGVECVPELWQDICEGVETARQHADKLHMLACNGEDRDKLDGAQAHPEEYSSRQSKG